MTEAEEKSAAKADIDFQSVAKAASARLSKNLPVRRNLPGEGRLRIDRQLPFLCVYRSPISHQDPGTRELVTTEAAYLFASGEPEFADGLSELCQQIHLTMQEHFGIFLFLEIWADPELRDEISPQDDRRPRFEIVTPDLESLPGTIDTFTSALSSIILHGRQAHVTVRSCDSVVPPGLSSLLPDCEQTGGAGCCVLGVAIKPIYRNEHGDTIFPILLQSLRRQLSRAFRKGIAQFTGFSADNTGVHYESLGPSSLVRAVRTVDLSLCDVAESFDFLLQVTPTNTEEAWNEFAKSNYRTTPRFFYRPLPYHPGLLKRRLFSIEIERIEDPTLAHIFGEKQNEVDRQLSALCDLDTPEFVYGSLQLYGEADAELVSLAEGILARFPKDEPLTPQNRFVSVQDLVSHAQSEIDHYRRKLTSFTASIEISDHIASGIMVSHDRLIISNHLRMRSDRIVPLLHHEIGTHLLTYFNGRCQPFQQLYSGLAGYDELQEGLAVLAEYLSGGLTANRVRNLAGRVIAVKSMTSRKTFQETFALLHEEFGFTPRQAFITTLRAYRGGGFTKDIIYLRGLRDLLKYLDSGHDIEPLYVGKIGLRHLPYVQELRRRGIIDAPVLLPRLWDDDKSRERLEACRGRSVLQLLEIDK